MQEMLLLKGKLVQVLQLRMPHSQVLIKPYNPMLKFTYKIKKRAKDKGDFRITKHGQMAEFSLRELNRNIEQVRKQAKEMEANAKLQGALLENIQRANPDLVAYMKKLSPKKR